MNHLSERNSVLNRPMYLCLCPVCLGQFLDTGIYKIVRENHGQAKERCDFCNYRNGYDFIIYSKAEKKDEVADEWQFEIPPAAGELNSNMLFADYLDQWLEVVRARIKPATFGSYQGMVKSTIGPYFRKKELTLKELEARHIQQFYTEKLKTVTPNSVMCDCSQTDFESFQPL